MQRFRKTMKRKRAKALQMNESPLALTQGAVYLPKGTRLYHTSMKPLSNLPQKPMLFMTYHPSEQYYKYDYVSVIELQKDVRLLFMVSLIHNLRIYSALNELLDSRSRNINLTKMKYDKIKEWIPFLQNEGFDGWLSPIEGKTTIEIAICMDPTILKIVQCLPIQINWNNSRYIEGKIIPKNWGSVYPLSPGPFRLILNQRFKPQIENYQKTLNEGEPRGTTFAIFLENAEIIQINAPVQKILWSN